MFNRRTTDNDWSGLLSTMRARVEGAMATKAPIFTTDTTLLFDLFLEYLPVSEQQHHTCRSCKKFFERYGGLVTVGENGTTTPLAWQQNDGRIAAEYRYAINAVYDHVARAKVNGVFYSSERMWGTVSNRDQRTGVQWTHLAVQPTTHYIWTNRAMTAEQAMAEKLQDFETLERAMAEFSKDQLEVACLITGEDNDLYRAEKVREWSKWLFDLKTKLNATREHKRKAHILWRAVATAPAGWAKPRSSVLGSLLDDIAEGKRYEEIKHNFETKMRPSNYQRPQAAPAQGTIVQAEKLFTQLGLEDSLLRRYARLIEIPSRAVLWAPRPLAAKPRTPSAPGMFSHVTPKHVGSTSGQPMVMSWARFQRTVLPHAQQIDVLIPRTAERFMALVTAAVSDAPPILQWDSETERNPFSWYYSDGIDADIRQRVRAAGGQVENVDIRCSLAWNNTNDLDLHCITPRNEHISYMSKQSPSGGYLDVDMNVFGESMKPVENIRWARGRAPEGRYQFFVNLYRTHGGYAQKTPFTIEVEVDGSGVFTMQGSSAGANQSLYTDRMVKVADFYYRRNEPVQFENAASVSVASGSPNAWNVQPGSYVPVTGVVSSPNLWGARPMEQHGQHAFFLLENCYDTRHGVGRGFYVEMVQSDLHKVRSVLEAYNATASIIGVNDANACGVGISNQNTGNITLRVNGTSLYTLDRWE